MNTIRSSPNTTISYSAAPWDTDSSGSRLRSPSTNSTTAVSTELAPWSLAVNPVTNKIYVANWDSANETVIDGATNSATATLTVGTGPGGIAVNPVTNRVYVTNSGSNNVTVIDVATSTTSTVSVGTRLGSW